MQHSTAGDQVVVSVPMTIVLCANCSIPFGVPQDYDTRRRDDGNTFHCPSGHNNVYPGEAKKREKALKTDLDLLRRDLDAANKAKKTAEAATRKARKERDEALAHEIEADKERGEAIFKADEAIKGRNIALDLVAAASDAVKDAIANPVSVSPEKPSDKVVLALSKAGKEGLTAKGIMEATGLKQQQVAACIQGLVNKGKGKVEVLNTDPKLSKQYRMSIWRPQTQVETTILTYLATLAKPDGSATLTNIERETGLSAHDLITNLRSLTEKGTVVEKQWPGKKGKPGARKAPGRRDYRLNPDIPDIPPPATDANDAKVMTYLLTLPEPHGAAMVTAIDRETGLGIREALLSVLRLVDQGKVEQRDHPSVGKGIREGVKVYRAFRKKATPPAKKPGSTPPDLATWQVGTNESRVKSFLQAHQDQNFHYKAIARLCKANPASLATTLSVQVYGAGPIIRVSPGIYKYDPKLEIRVLRRRVFELLKASKPMMPQAIAIKLGVPLKHTQATLQYLDVTNHVYKDTDGRYDIDPDTEWHGK